MSEAPNQSPRLGAVGSIVAVSVGRPTTVDRRGHEAVTAIFKTPVAGPVRVVGVNLDGDDQADRNAHGGVDKAVYAYGDDDRRWWESQLSRELAPGSFGENLTVEGLDLGQAVVGERWRVGTTLLEVSEPRVPCWKLNLRMGDDRFIQKFNEAGRPGSYLRIIEEGALEQGDTVEVVSVPPHDLTVAEVAAIYRAPERAQRLLGVDELSDAWQDWARRALERSRRQ